MQEKFSIFIPTYNRWRTLAKTLEKTLANNCIGAPIVISDNDSLPEGREEVSKIIEKYAHISCKIIKNDMNIGGDANILRCIELCQTPYVLVLGDDDFLSDDYASKVTKYLSTDTQWGFISFKDRAIKGIDDKTFDSPFDMVRFINDWSALLFTSTSIFNTQMFKYGMWEAHRAQISCSSHLVGMLKGWELSPTSEKKWKFLLSAERLVVSSGHARDPKSFDLLNVFAGFSILEYFFNEGTERQIICSAVRGGTKRVFKPRVLAKVLFFYTLKFEFAPSWQLMLFIRKGLFYTIGFRSIFYKWYLPVVVLVASFISLFN